MKKVRPKTKRIRLSTDGFHYPQYRFWGMWRSYFNTNGLWSGKIRYLEYTAAENFLDRIHELEVAACERYNAKRVFKWVPK